MTITPDSPSPGQPVPGRQRRSWRWSAGPGNDLPGQPVPGRQRRSWRWSAGPGNDLPGQPVPGRWRNRLATLPTTVVIIPLLRAAHPEPAVAVTAVAGLLALAAGHRPASAALVTATVAASQLTIGWANDAIDASRDAAVSRTGKPVAEGAISRRAVGVAAGVAAVATVLLALSFDPPATAVAVAGLASALAYDWPLKLTPLSVLPYAVSFAALPAFVVLAVPATPPLWLVAAGGLLGAGAHFANVLPDLADDAATGVRGLPHRLGATGSALAAATLLLAATVVLVAGRPGPPSRLGLAVLLVAAVALPAGWYAGRGATAARRRPTALFRAFQAVALCDVALLLLAGRTI